MVENMIKWEQTSSHFLIINVKMCCEGYSHGNDAIEWKFASLIISLKLDSEAQVKNC